MFIHLYQQVEVQRNWMLIKLRNGTLTEDVINDRMGRLLDQVASVETRFTTAMLGCSTKKEKNAIQTR